MIRKLGWMAVLALAGCSGVPAAPAGNSACSANPAGYQCQVDMYSKAGG